MITSKFIQSWFKNCRFFEETEMPGVIGLIDCTHIALSAMPKRIESSYYNRKGFHSINTQIVSFFVIPYCALVIK